MAGARSQENFWETLEAKMLRRFSLMERKILWLMEGDTTLRARGEQRSGTSDRKHICHNFGSILQRLLDGGEETDRKIYWCHCGTAGKVTRPSWLEGALGICAQPVFLVQSIGPINYFEKWQSFKQIPPSRGVPGWIWLEDQCYYNYCSYKKFERGGRKETLDTRINWCRQQNSSMHGGICYVHASKSGKPPKIKQR